MANTGQLLESGHHDQCPWIPCVSILQVHGRCNEKSHIISVTNHDVRSKGFESDRLQPSLVKKLPDLLFSEAMRMGDLRVILDPRLTGRLGA